MSTENKPRKKKKSAGYDLKKRLLALKKQKLDTLLEEAGAGDIDQAEAHYKEQDLRPPEDREIDEALARSAIQEEKMRLRKLRIKQASWIAGALFVSYIIHLLFKPYEGTMDYGICKVFLETQVQYPEHLHLTGAEEYSDRVRIWYRQVDAFGQYRLERIQCNFKTDPARGRILAKIIINRETLDPKIVEAFNLSIPAIRAYPPDLAYPFPMPSSLEGLKFETDLFRRQIF